MAPPIQGSARDRREDGEQRKFDEKMRDDGRSVCLVLDNCSAYHIEDLALTNVELKFLLPNVTLPIQPLDQGIINSVKSSYQRRLIDKLLLDLRLKRQTKVDIFQVLEMLSASWKVTTKEVIKNCFRKAGFETPAASAPEEVDSEEPNGGASSSSTIPRESERNESQEALLEKDEQDQEALSGAWRSLHSDSHSRWCCSGGLSLGDSCVVATEEVTDDSIVKDVLGESEDDDSKADAEDPCEVPSSREVLDAIDVLGRETASLRSLMCITQ
ncbi:hypothetical protein HPB47_009721 [Ixodes persulcatus]|uniref:Uncharacterized protein n=1 Tax=Ixodes persulcatus TaxID=34615 RepID=A0AC60P1G4_IXOPE|nr:hypothetical protein HPB47_009721 [Ixodes persulcatus]